MGRTVAGWALEERLGRGGFGEVWLGRKLSVGLVRAVKLVPVSDERSFESWRHEIDRLEALSHPNIVRLYDAGIVTDDGPYQDYAWIATELCERSLADELRRRGPRRPEDRVLSFEEGDRLLDEMLAALAAAHSGDSVHRDIKPANILLHADGTWKLCDFGTGRLVPADQSRPYTTVIGTLPYMSPAAHRGRQDYAADLYALGVVLHEAMCGRRLHHKPKGMTDSEYVKLILDASPTISTDLPDRWQTAIRALAGLDVPASAQALGEWFHATRGSTSPSWVARPTSPRPLWWSEEGKVVAWAHYLGGRQGYPRRLNGVKLTIDDWGIYMRGPYRVRFLIYWHEVDEVATEPNPDVDKPETTYVTRLVTQSWGSSTSVSMPATVYFRIDTVYNESVTFAIAGVSLSQFRDGLATWVDWSGHGE